MIVRCDRRGGIETSWCGEISSAKMWRLAAVWRLSTVLLVGATIDFRFLTQRNFHVPAQVDCFVIPPLTSHRMGRSVDNGWLKKRSLNGAVMPVIRSTPNIFNDNKVISRRFDQLLPSAEEIVKEHAKLVNDINSLKQVVFVAPFIDENRDYEDSIFNELIETSTTIRPKTKRVTETPVIKQYKPTSIPIILLGGASQQEVVKTQPIKYTKPISLVGTSVSPLAKHPYPFVMQAKSQRPFKFCMQPTSGLHPSMMYTTTRRPSLLERIIRSILPR